MGEGLGLGLARAGADGGGDEDEDDEGDEEEPRLEDERPPLLAVPPVVRIPQPRLFLLRGQEGELHPGQMQRSGESGSGKPPFLQSGTWHAVPLKSGRQRQLPFPALVPPFKQQGPGSPWEQFQELMPDPTTLLGQGSI